MSKWINVDAFVADARMVGLDTAEKVFFALAHQPGIDIVHCRECAKRMTDDCPMCNECNSDKVPTEDDFYCGYGEREGE